MTAASPPVAFNCFNMAIAGALIAYGTYRLIAGRSAITDATRGCGGNRRILRRKRLGPTGSGGVRIQPLLYHAMPGAPLYCPYPLSVAIPAMMLGHLTIAGIAEAFVSAGVVVFLQRSDPAVLQPTLMPPKLGVPSGSASSSPRQRPGHRATSAFGQRSPCSWSSRRQHYFSCRIRMGRMDCVRLLQPAARTQMPSGVARPAPPAHAPEGLARLYTAWIPCLHATPRRWSAMRALDICFRRCSARG